MYQARQTGLRLSVLWQKCIFLFEIKNVFSRQQVSRLNFSEVNQFTDLCKLVCKHKQMRFNSKTRLALFSIIHQSDHTQSRLNRFSAHCNLNQACLSSSKYKLNKLRAVLYINQAKIEGVFREDSWKRQVLRPPFSFLVLV